MTLGELQIAIVEMNECGDWRVVEFHAPDADIMKIIKRAQAFATLNGTTTKMVCVPTHFNADEFQWSFVIMESRDTWNP